MKSLKKYLITLAYILGTIIILSSVISLLNYFSIIPNSLFKWLKIIIAIISFFIGGFYIGKNANNKGYLEGIKIGLIFVVIMFLFAILGYSMFKWTMILYYIILILTSMLGAMLGINKRKETK